MEKELRLAEDIRALKEKTQILSSILLAVYVAQQEPHYDAAMYTEAIHGSSTMAQELVDGLRRIEDSILERQGS